MDRPTAIRARIARAKQLGEPPEVIEEMRREYYASRALGYIREWVTGTPAPTAAHRAEAAALLRDGADAAA